MNRFLWDENTSHHPLRAIRQERPDIDVVTVQDVGLTGADDGTVIAWAAAHDRVLVTQDRNTLIGIAADRVRAGRRVAGIVVLQMEHFSPGAAATELAALADTILPGEWENRFVFLPLR